MSPAERSTRPWDEIHGRLSFADPYPPEILRLGRSSLEASIRTLILDPRLTVDAKWRCNGGIDVATLNVKNLPDGLYRRLQARAKRERRSVAQEVTHLLSEVLESPKPLSILELQGLGKEHWEGVDAAAHVEHERADWD